MNSRPPNQPIVRPPINCQTISRPIQYQSGKLPLATAPVIVKVRMTAIGSLLPDSISSVEATRSLICSPLD